ncbi:hypothetical protein [Deinococcus wulumuqiensis]|uniref:hypothetical protein n=1 Tax=Deinococcus wulumuqiensis TaxID=980427 RepID=UPI002433180D|nr:hypothetical protein [Deinococcus wulumuqiensis]
MPLRLPPLALAAPLLALLPACSPRVLSADGWNFRVGDTQGAVRLVSRQEFGVCSARLVGCTVPVGHGCLVMLDRDYFLNGTPRQRTLLLAHEVGHCLDASVLEYGHGGIGAQGAVYGEYYRPAVEGFAESYARAYVARCGDNLAPLGYGAGPECEVPDPRRVTAEPPAR